MNMLSEVRVVVLVMLFVSLFVLTGCSNSHYSVDYKLKGGQSCDYVCATIKGPAAKLAVILTGPDGKSGTNIIQKDELITNSHTVEIQQHNPQAGAYILEVKTVDPEAVVAKKEFTLSSGQVTVKDVQVGLSFRLNGANNITLSGGVNVLVQNAGSLPVTIDPFSLVLGIDDIDLRGSLSDDVIIDQGMARIGFIWINLQEGRLKHGGRYLLKGKLLYNGHNSLDFEKEFVMP